VGNKAPTYLKDLIGRLSSFTEEPRLAGLLGLAVTVAMDMAFTSAKRSAGRGGAGPASGQVGGAYMFMYLKYGSPERTVRELHVGGFLSRVYED